MLILKMISNKNYTSILGSPIGCGESLSPSITPVVSSSMSMNINKRERYKYLHIPNSLSGSLSTFDVSS
jgi:hypothetical protein